MIDKINRLNTTSATTGLLKYGTGEVTFQTNGEVAAFEIGYSGKIQGINKLGNGWSIKIGENKIVIFSLAQTELTELLFTYIGSFSVTYCEFATWDNNLYTANTKNISNDQWSNNSGQWQSDARKPEEIINQKIIKKPIKKSVI